MFYLMVILLRLTLLIRIRRLKSIHWKDLKLHFNKEEAVSLTIDFRATSPFWTSRSSWSSIWKKKKNPNIQVLYVHPKGLNLSYTIISTLLCLVLTLGKTVWYYSLVHFHVYFALLIKLQQENPRNSFMNKVNIISKM